MSNPRLSSDYVTTSKAAQQLRISRWFVNLLVKQHNVDAYIAYASKIANDNRAYKTRLLCKFVHFEQLKKSLEAHHEQIKNKRRK